MNSRLYLFYEHIIVRLSAHSCSNISGNCIKFYIKIV